MTEKEKDYNQLTEKQKRFIDYYIETANATESARRAGYSEKTADRIGHENLRKLEKMIQEKLKEKSKGRIAKQEEVLEFLTETLRLAGADRKDRIKCAELLGKRYGTFKETIEIEQNKPLEVNINVIKNGKKTNYGKPNKQS